MKKIETLLDEYKLNQKALLISVGISCMILVISAIVSFIKKSSSSWLGFLFLGIALVLLVEGYFINRYMKKRIKELQEKEAAEKMQLQSLKNKIKELEEKQALDKTDFK